MARSSSFTVLYVAGMSALQLVAAIVGLKLNDERSPGLVGTIEIPVMLVGALLFVAAGVGRVRSPQASWPLLAAFAAVVLVSVLVFLVYALSAFSTVLIFEGAAVICGVLLVVTLRRR